MDFNKFKQNFNFITNLLLLGLLFVGGIAWADSNGIWHRAEDVRPGVFGSDEYSGTYIFQNSVNIGEKLTVTSIEAQDINVTNNLCLDDECHVSWKTVCESWVLNNSIN